MLTCNTCITMKYRRYFPKINYVLKFRLIILHILGRTNRSRGKVSAPVHGIRRPRPSFGGNIRGWHERGVFVSRSYQRVIGLLLFSHRSRFPVIGAHRVRRPDTHGVL